MDHNLFIHSSVAGHGLFPPVGYCAVHICAQAFEDLFSVLPGGYIAVGPAGSQVALCSTF